MKDNFSGHAADYAKFRPKYPEALYNFILANTRGRKLAWDCATGSGQVAFELANHFDQIKATDLSVKQLENAIQKSNINYSFQVAEHTNFNGNSFDLITVGQAYHWFDFEKFHKEVHRVLKPEGALAIFGYGLHRIDETLDRIVDHFYFEIIGPYWDEERKYIDEQYRNTPFPYREINCPMFVYEVEWSLEHYIGYLNTWSAVKHYIKANGHNPVDQLERDIRSQWQEEMKVVKFPIFMRLGTL